MKIISIIALGCSFIAFSCKNRSDNKAIKLKPIQKAEIPQTERFTLKTINLDLFKAKKIKEFPSVEHKTLSKVPEKDSLLIAPGVSSILNSVSDKKPQSDYDSEIILSNLKITNNGSVIFAKDSILAVAPFEYNQQEKLLSVCVIKDQNSDTFSTTSDLYLINIITGKQTLIGKDITNSCNAPFSKFQRNTLFYLNNSVVYAYNYLTKSSTKIFSISNNYTITNIIEASDHVFKIVYLKDLAEGDLYLTTIDFSNKQNL